MKPSLDEIVANKRAEVSERKRTSSAVGTSTARTNGRERMLAALSKPQPVCLIAEIKPRSPSAGQLAASVDLDKIVTTYQRHAAAISVLTDRKYFGGSFEALAQVARCDLPVLCKEFIIDPIQLEEAADAGAAAVLLIVKILSNASLAELKTRANLLGLATVVEVQTESELQRALSIKPDVLLINNRNLSTYEIDLATSERLAPSVPRDVPLVSASGIESRADIERLLPFTNKFLVGSSLMKSANVEDKLRELCGK